MSISYEPDKAINQLQDHGFTLKGGAAIIPESYVGAELAFKRLDIHDTNCWTLSTTKYIKHSIDNLEERLTKMNRSLPNQKQCSTPIVQGYKPELDWSRLRCSRFELVARIVGEFL